MGKILKDRYIFAEQIKLIAKQAPPMIWLTLFTALIISLILLGNVEVWIPLLLFAAMLLLNGARFWHYNKVKQEKITVDNAGYHGAFFVGFSFAGGAIWGALGLVSPTLLDPFLLVMTAVLLCGLVAGSVSYLSTYKVAFFAYAIPCISPFAIRCLMSHQEMLVAIGILMFMFLMVNLFMSHLAQINILTGINLVQENRELIEKLKFEKSNADEARNIADHDNEAKSRFLAAASHDLRQPLHAMGFFVEALQHEKNPAEIMTLTKKISQTSEALRNLLGSLLDISKIEAGGMEPNRSHFDLNDLLTGVIQEFTELAQEKELDISHTPCAQTVYSDKEMLGRIIRNLVSNAVHYTDIGYVNISCETENGYVTIRVSDSGIGIPENKKKDIFREFFQINERKNEPSHGLGLGLSIVEGLCHLLGHEISLRSEVAIGSVFSLKVPLGNLNEITPETSAHHILPGDVIAKTIILNNENDSLESISGIMQHWGHVVADFNTCAEVIAFLASEDFIPDLVISDIKLQDASGIEAMAAIQEKVARKIPGIIMTGDGDEAVIEAVRSNGFSVLQKPVQPAKLRSMVSFLVQEQPS